MIKISVPNDDHVALRAMAKALEEIAVARGAPAQSVTIKPFTERMALLEKALSKETPESLAAKLASYEPEVDTTSQQVESLSFDGRDPDNCTLPEPPTTDSTGTPWDERIHSASKALNADGTWRLRRKPKDMDETEWSVFVQNVQNELLAKKPVGLTNDGDIYIDPTHEKGDETAELTIEPAVTPEGDDFHVDAGVVTEQQVASFPPPPPVPVPSVQAALERGMERYGDAISKLAENDGAPSLTFPQVMAFLTERHGRITSAQVDQIIADMGLEKITDLNTQPEHTVPFIVRVKALLGE